MSKVLRATSYHATPYTPVFPPPLPVLNSPSAASTSSDSAATSSDELNKTQKPYIDRLKERYLLLASVPEELCPASREASPEAEHRIAALRLRMRKARELRRPLELTLACVGVKGGDWVGDPLSNEDQHAREYILPATEEEWFEWEKKRNVAQEKRKVDKAEAETRNRITKWSEEIQEGTSLETNAFPGPSHEQPRRDNWNALGFAVVNRDAMDHVSDKAATSRYFPPPSPPPRERHREQSDPVERNSSPIPPAPALDPLPDFCDSFSLPDSPPVLPREIEQHPPLLDDLPPSPSFAVKDKDTSTPPKRDNIPGPILQLSSPISPPRSLRPLTASQTSLFPMSSKRPRESNEANEHIPVEKVNHEPSTPRGLKRARTMVEPITPKSVARPNGSQEHFQDPKRLPTLNDLLAASSRKSASRRGTPLTKGKGQRKVGPTPTKSPSPSPRRPRIASSVVPDFSPSQPTYSMFRPRFQSTQHRAWSLPPSPSHPLTLTQPLSPQKTYSGPASSGIFYQSQFNVESRIDQVASFLNADVWDMET